jgi:hypothetical protein
MEEDKEESCKKKLRQDNPPATAASLFTDDLILEILSRLPARSLCRFKCVSVPWRDLIADPVNRKKLPQTLAGFVYTTYNRPSIAWSYHFVGVSGSAASVDPSLPFLQLNKDEYIIHVDTCNGLLLCARLNRKTPAADKNGFRYIVCNPATKRWIELPPQLQDWENRFYTATRLAFDPTVSSHFHVVEFVQSSLGLGSYVTGVDIFSSQTGAWIFRDSSLVEKITLFFGTRGLFGSQPHFAKPNFGCHSFIGRCLVLATLWRVIFYFSYDPLVIELLSLPILAKVWLQIF